MAKLNNDNDLVRRGDMRDALMRMAKPLVGGGIATFVVDYPNAVDSVPAVPQPMSAVEFIKQFNRICSSERSLCPLYGEVNCDLFHSQFAERYVELIEKWAQEHPERST